MEFSTLSNAFGNVINTPKVNCCFSKELEFHQLIGRQHHRWNICFENGTVFHKKYCFHLNTCSGGSALNAQESQKSRVNNYLYQYYHHLYRSESLLQFLNHVGIPTFQEILLISANSQIKVSQGTKAFFDNIKTSIVNT